MIGRTATVNLPCLSLLLVPIMIVENIAAATPAEAGAAARAGIETIARSTMGSLVGIIRNPDLYLR